MSLFFTVLSAVVFTVILLWTARECVTGSDVSQKISHKTFPIPFGLIGALTVVRFIIILAILLITRRHITSFAAWDGHHYMFMSENGYVSSGEGVEFIVFYPLYPLLMAVLNFITQNSFVSGMVISNLCFVVSMGLFYRLCLWDLSERDSGFALCLFALSPFSFFFSGVYTESLFVMLSLLFFIFLRKNKYLPAVIFGALAALCRVHGVLLSAAALFYLFQNNRKKLCFAFIIPVGTFIYLILNKLILGDFFAFSVYQEEIWSQHFSFFAKNIGNYINYISSGSDLTIPIMLPQLILFFLSCSLIFSALWKKQHLPYIIYSIIYVFVTYSASWLLSGGRYLCALFPLFIFTASAVKNRYIRLIIILFSVLLMLFYTYMYLTGNQVM